MTRYASRRQLYQIAIDLHQAKGLGERLAEPNPAARDEEDELPIIQKLPNELILLIAKFLGRSDLNSLVQTGRQFHTVLTPALYAREIISLRDYAFASSSIKRPKPSLAEIVEKFGTNVEYIKKPNIGRHVSTPEQFELFPNLTLLGIYDLGEDLHSEVRRRVQELPNAAGLLGIDLFGSPGLGSPSTNTPPAPAQVPPPGHSSPHSHIYSFITPATQNAGVQTGAESDDDDEMPPLVDSNGPVEDDMFELEDDIPTLAPSLVASALTTITDDEMPPLIDVEQAETDDEMPPLADTNSPETDDYIPALVGDMPLLFDNPMMDSQMPAQFNDDASTGTDEMPPLVDDTNAQDNDMPPLVDDDMPALQDISGSTPPPLGGMTMHSFMHMLDSDYFPDFGEGAGPPIILSPIQPPPPPFPQDIVEAVESGLFGHPRRQPLDYKKLAEEAAEKTSRWVNEYRRRFEQITVLDFRPCGVQSLNNILEACKNLSVLNISLRDRPTIDPRKILDAVVDYVGQTLQRLTIFDAPVYGKGKTDIFASTLGNDRRCPALRSVRFLFMPGIREGPKDNQKKFLLDLHRAATRNKSWRLDQDVGETMWSFLVDDILTMEGPEFRLVYPWLQKFLKNDDKYIRLRDIVTPEEVEHLFSLEHPLWVSFHLEEPPPLVGYGSMISHLQLSAHDIEGVEDPVEVPELCLELTEEWVGFLNEFLPTCTNLVSFSTTEGTSPYRLYFLGDECLRPLISDLNKNHKLRELDLDAKALLKGGRVSLDYESLMDGENYLEKLMEHTNGVGEIRWVGEPGVLPNLTSLKLQNIYILSDPDRMWFYGIPAALVKLEHFAVWGLCWDPAHGTAEDFDEGRYWKLLKQHSEKYEVDLELDLRFDEFVNHWHRKRRVLERVENELQRRTEEATPGRKLQIVIENLWLFEEDVEDMAEGMLGEEDWDVMHTNEERIARGGSG